MSVLKSRSPSSDSLRPKWSMPLVSVLRQSLRTASTFGCRSCAANSSRMGLMSGLTAFVSGMAFGVLRVRRWPHNRGFRSSGPLSRTPQFEPREIFAANHFDHVIAFAVTHMGYVDGRHGIVGPHLDDGSGLRARQSPAGKQRRQRTFEASQIQYRFAHGNKVAAP